ncbi:glycoside hydrolase family 130 protein [Aliifodinibius sp. S!AR15-10]|uniref:glycoside hydrolase family 130 protein n=1 Tax=Aliifodinibius sp. S!AR15-10 TaxID=2950437 RepID=UPI002859CD60|nr:glycoside hydrolase family 130 protein [Aliifodinibius sp. S!AR15-10]MDR8391593.1 glycoside hydrolase family 130 protein [Aliifodinibius sp. S!AR15-10]
MCYQTKNNITASVLIFLALVTFPVIATAQWQIGPFQKYEDNPILVSRGDSWEAKDVFNPTAWTDGHKVYLLYRAEDSTGIGKWNGTSRIGLATSSDGIHFSREKKPILEPTESWELPGGTEDPRITKIDSTFYLTYTAYDGETARLALATSTDLRSWKKHGLIFPNRGWTKSGAILDEQINGKYWMYFGDTNIWVAWSTDLLNWNVIEEPVMKPRNGKFDSRLVEPGPSPILTEDGILLLYNGANDDLIYNAGQVLFERNDPTKVIARSNTSFMQPDTQLERHGQIPNVVFVEGLVNFDDTWFLYYGMGDSGIGVAIETDNCFW